MTSIPSQWHKTLLMLIVALLAWPMPLRAFDDSGDSESTPPAVGDKVPDFELPTLDGENVRLSELTQQGPVVLVVLRGFPGYQCPICNLQVGSLLGSAGKFEEAGAEVVMVYPGAEKQLDQRADEFVGKRSLPEHFHFLIDPGYEFTNAYHLRWDAPRETAYPSAFVIDQDNRVQYAKVSKTHGGRVAAKELLDALAELESAKN